MTKTVRQIVRTLTTLVGDESFEGQDATGSFQAPVSAITSAVVVTVDVTTGAAPVDIDLDDYGNWIVVVVRVTSGGTAGVEVLNFLGPTIDTAPGRTLNVVFSHLTVEGDVIHITHNTDEVISCIDNLGNSIGNFDTGILDEEGNNIVFGFNGDIIPQYSWNCLYGTWDNPTVISEKRNPLPPEGLYGQVPMSQGGEDVEWASGFLTPFSLLNAGTVASLNSTYPAGSNPRGMAVVTDADTPVVGAVVVGGGAVSCVVIPNAANTDYVVMFILP